MPDLHLNDLNCGLYSAKEGTVSVGKFLNGDLLRWLRHDEPEFRLKTSLLLTPCLSASAAAMNAAFTPLISDDPDAANPTVHDNGTASGLSLTRSSSLSSSSGRVIPPKLTLLNGLALVISLQIGSGIFTIPSQVSQFVPSPGVGLVVWLVAGLLVWTGAASFIELGLRVPSNGGIQEYLRAAYGNDKDEEDVGPRGELAGFLFTWTWVFLAKPAANGAIATIAANYLSRPFIGDEGLSPLMSRLIALACIAFITFVNCLGASSGARAANMFLMLKLTALCSIIVLGLVTWVGGSGAGVPSSPETGWFGASPKTSDELSMGNFVTAIFGAVFCYGGWETVSCPSPEILK